MADYRDIEGVEEMDDGSVMVGKDIKIDKQGNVFVAEYEEVTVEELVEVPDPGLGKSWAKRFRKSMKKTFKRIGKVAKRAGKYVVPAAAGVLLGAWGSGAIKRAAIRAKELRDKVNAARKRGNTLIVDKFGKDIEVPMRTATPQQAAVGRAQVRTRAQTQQAQARARAAARRPAVRPAVRPGEKTGIEKALPYAAIALLVFKSGLLS